MLLFIVKNVENFLLIKLDSQLIVEWGLSQQELTRKLIIRGVIYKSDRKTYKTKSRLYLVLVQLLIFLYVLLNVT